MQALDQLPLEFSKGPQNVNIKALMGFENVGLFQYLMHEQIQKKKKERNNTNKLINLSLKKIEGLQFFNARGPNGPLKYLAYFNPWYTTLV